MKKLFGLILAICMLAGNACATILEPKGVDLAFKLFSGIEAREAVVLCRSLSALADHAGNAKKVKSLSVGDTFLTWESWNEWQNCYYSDGKDPAWVRDYYVLTDPAYYVTDGQTAVYAYGDTTAPRVALLGRNEELPIILETEDWCVVGLRGAAGWIRKTSKDNVHQSRFQPDSLYNLKSAELIWAGDSITVSDPHVLARLSALLTDVNSMGRSIAGCPFDNYLRLTLETDEELVLALASDSCAIFRANGKDYRYGNTQHISSQTLYSLFPGYHK